MDFLRKLAAIIVMILSIVGFLLCVGGIFGAWAVNEPATQGIVTALDAANQFLGVADNTSGVASQTVGDVSARLAEIQSAAADLSPESRPPWPRGLRVLPRCSASPAWPWRWRSGYHPSTTR
jgi:hypothetical protein